MSNARQTRLPERNPLHGELDFYFVEGRFAWAGAVRVEEEVG